MLLSELEGHQVLAGEHSERVRPPPEAVLRRRLRQELSDEGPGQERRLPARLVPDEQGRTCNVVFLLNLTDVFYQN